MAGRIVWAGPEPSSAASVLKGSVTSSEAAEVLWVFDCCTGWGGYCSAEPSLRQRGKNLVDVICQVFLFFFNATKGVGPIILGLSLMSLPRDKVGWISQPISICTQTKKSPGGRCNPHPQAFLPSVCTPHLTTISRHVYTGQKRAFWSQSFHVSLLWCSL